MRHILFSTLLSFAALSMNGCGEEQKQQTPTMKCEPGKCGEGKCGDK